METSHSSSLVRSLPLYALSFSHFLIILLNKVGVQRVKRGHYSNGKIDKTDIIFLQTHLEDEMN